MSPVQTVTYVSGSDIWKIGAGSRIRTRDPEITNHVLYQLSYTGAGNGFYQIGRACLCPGRIF